MIEPKKSKIEQMIKAIRNAGKSRPNFNFDRPNFMTEVWIFKLHVKIIDPMVEIKLERSDSMYLVLQCLYLLCGLFNLILKVVGSKGKDFKLFNIIVFISSILWAIIVSLDLDQKEKNYSKDQSLYLLFDLELVSIILFIYCNLLKESPWMIVKDPRVEDSWRLEVF